MPGHPISPIDQRVIDILKEDKNALNWVYNKYMWSSEFTNICEGLEKSLKAQLMELLNSQALANEE